MEGDDAMLNIVEASIEDLQSSLGSGAITCVELVALYLRRISAYDCRGISLNSIPVLNPRVFEEAAESDERRAAGKSRGALEGIPYTVKDSYKVKGLTVASGSPAFANLISNEDAFTVQQLRSAGAVLIGKTNMPPMAAGGMQRGLYGRAESPYNLDYLAAAFSSGSSNGSAVSTAASFAAFGMGEETVSSGRSPASNNALVAYTPSRGLISIRGNWPLYPTCDVVVPHTRTMSDMFSILDVVTANDEVSAGDFWRHQELVKLPQPLWADRPKSFLDIPKTGHVTLKDLRIAVPQMYIGGPQPAGTTPVVTSPEVIAVWERARRDLEALGATVIPTSDFPLITNYENPSSISPTQSPDTILLPKDWNSIERGPLIAHAWDEFLRKNADPKLPTLPSVKASSRISPAPPLGDVQVRYAEPANAIHWDKLVDYIKDPTSCPQKCTSIYDHPELPAALQALETARKRDLEDWMDELNVDCVVFPANGDVGRADADVTDASARHAWKNGVKYSNGNRALRHLGVPTVSVPMGCIEGTGMPVNLTFAGKGWDDVRLLGWAEAFERKTKRRVRPGLTPALESDVIMRTPTEGRVNGEALVSSSIRTELEVSSCRASVVEASALKAAEKILQVDVTGKIQVHCGVGPGLNPASPSLEILVDAMSVPLKDIVFTKTDDKKAWKFRCSVLTPAPIERDERSKTEAQIPRDMTMVVVVAKIGSGEETKATGWLGLLGKD